MSEGAKVLERDPFGAKVLLLSDGSIFKLFRRKRFLSSAALIPYAQRFVKNAGLLAGIGIPVPETIDLVRISGLGRDVVHYRPLPGKTLRELNQSGFDPETKQRLRDMLTCLIIRLHDKGFYFRSLHLGNVVLTPEGRLGLIDFSDMRRHPWPLTRYFRARNMRRMQRIDEERDWLDLEAILKAKPPLSGGC